MIYTAVLKASSIWRCITDLYYLRTCISAACGKEVGKYKLLGRQARDWHASI
jgi:hypothetical protein